MADETQPTDPKQVEFSPEHLAFLGVETAEEARAMLAETKTAKSAKLESEFSEIESSVSKEQLSALKSLFGDSKADIIRGFAELKEAGFVPGGAKVSQIKRPATAPTLRAPTSAPSTEFDHHAEWQRLQKLNQITARNYFLAHKHAISSRKVG